MVVDEMESNVLKDRAYTAIKEQLLNGDIPPGSRIREDIIAKEFAVSRTPVREAINQLYRSGFVEIIPRHGIFAATITKETLLELTQVRESLSALAVRCCCARITEAEVENLYSILEKYDDACDRKDLHSRNILDGQFHKQIALYSGNSILYSYLSDIEDKAIYSRNMINYSFFQTDSRRVHREMVDAIRKHDVEAAVESTIKNVNHLYESMGSVIK